MRPSNSKSPQKLKTIAMVFNNRRLIALITASEFRPEDWPTGYRAPQELSCPDRNLRVEAEGPGTGQCSLDLVQGICCSYARAALQSPSPRPAEFARHKPSPMQGEHCKTLHTMR